MKATSTLQNRLAKVFLLGIAASVLGTASCFAYDVVRVEEHWQLSVGGPDEGLAFALARPLAEEARNAVAAAREAHDRLCDRSDENLAFLRSGHSN